MDYQYGMRSILLAGLAVITVVSAAAQQSRLQREPGSIHLEDIGAPSVRLKVTKPIDTYFDIAMKRYLGTLRVPQQIELLAISDNAYRIRGNAQQGQVAGWVPIKSLPEISNEFVANVKQAAERQALVAELIANKEVAVGMTPEEVVQSLGRPEKKSMRVDAAGRLDLWEYITYKYIPQTRTVFDRFNRPFNETYYVKVPDGRMAVEFQNDVVNSIEKIEGTLLEGGAKIVAPPIEIFY